MTTDVEIVGWGCCVAVTVAAMVAKGSVLDGRAGWGRLERLPTAMCAVPLVTAGVGSVFWWCCVEVDVCMGLHGCAGTEAGVKVCVT